MNDLPIYEIQSDLTRALQHGNRVILQAPTGSGKSTQVPSMILDAGMIEDGKEIVVLQPRRLAARMLAKRVAFERGCPLGDEVGYQVRLDRKTSSNTRICYVTQGILLRQWLSDPSLKDCGCLVFDEFHERHLYGDLTLAHALGLQASDRPDLKLILMSATLNTEPLKAFLPDAQVLSSEGRTHPVNIHYLLKDPQATRTPIWDSASDAANRLSKATPGHLLIFMPGRYEIDRTLEALKRSPLGREDECVGLHGDLQASAQDHAVAPSSRRKVIVATNIAETSLTIDGVTGVIDSGLVRIARYDPVRGVDSLETESISKASADQRSGRAGRTAPGECVRLWTEAGHRNRTDRETPEIHRMDLCEPVLMLAALGITNWNLLALPDPPEEGPLQLARQTLIRLGALKTDGRITSTGKRLLDVPAHPRIGRLMLEARDRGVEESAARIAALLQGRPLFVRTRSDAIRRKRLDLFSENTFSDLLVQLNALEWAESIRFDRGMCEELGVHAQAGRQAVQTAKLFRRSRDPESSSQNRNADLRKCLAVAFTDHLAKRRSDSRRCDLIDGRVAELDPDTSVPNAGIVVASEIRMSERSPTPILSGVTVVEEEWLEELWPEAFRQESVVRYDAHLKRVIGEDRRQLGELVLETRVTHEVSDDDASRILMQELDKGELSLPGWNGEVDRWITRMNCLAAWRPDWQIPTLTEEDRRVLLEHMLSGCRTRKDVKNLDVESAVKDWLDPMQQQLVQTECPTRIKLPNGRNAKVRYEEGHPPVIISKLQDFFGMTESPTVAGGTISCNVELLAPNGRPAALTDDLGRFWKQGYALVRKDLKGRYPKHDWPETV